MYEAYKALRNFARRLNRVDALLQMWSFFQNINHGKQLPNNFCRINKKGIPSIKDVIHPWELDILTREVILHSAGSKERDLYNTDHLGAAINLIRKLTDIQNRENLEATVLYEMQRIYQQQAQWHVNTKLMLARYLKIYKTECLAEVLTKGTTLTVKQFYTLGISISGHFLTNYLYNTKQDYTPFGISDEQRDAFLEKMVFGFDDLRKRTANVQEYNENWSYTINPLISTPLVVMDPQTPNIVICPIPFYLMSRFSEGLFFDIAKIKGYENPYGAAFEKYVGDVSEILNDALNYSVIKPEAYRVGKSLRHGADWIIKDKNGAILVECKAKRLNLKARYELDFKALYSEIEVMARYVVQNYKNLDDLIKGVSSSEPYGEAIYPVIVTLVNWNLFGPKAFEQLEKSVLSHLDVAGLPQDYVKRHPYTIMSVEEYEIALQVINQTGVKEFFSVRDAEDHRGWMVLPFIRTKFKKQIENCRTDYLHEEMKELQDELAILVKA
ncbi:hypothetical protein [Pseudomonas savastanoi]|uniref:Restriction endonuclease n=2 Tax=Pseudomonas savastanoi TaxID=29438 RepID=A0AAW3M8Z9_PSESS|nr:hypothetical protein [Pseudomonas savastanoi]KTC62436.1 hypothetical protein AO287_26600 [Pseudomonas savastanoi]RMM98931.1 hypothetical protein ALQ68_01689 [Pseudomonas savastanoi pv. glycinea]RMP90679.1 hypothetical protein ALQ13_02678 [Pseudomonas savastanoi pv. glycinea]RMQ90077.1 hypothetical protein ALP96_03866 [Pseudomonas savastanoi pv. glycinea]RMQ95229.1 hypothetical protein ALP95_03406 [Pseudomonas savastanoi pv. glycinea]